MASFGQWLNRTYLSILTGINIFFAALLLLTYLAPFVPPTYIYPLALLALGFPFLVLANVLFVGWWIYKRERKVYISLATLGVGFVYLLNLFGLNLRSAPLPQEPLRVVSYNVRYFNAPLIANAEKLKQLQATMLNDIGATQPSILCGQEFSSKTQDANQEITKHLKQKLGLTHHYKGGGSSLAIFSKYPIKETGMLQFADTYNGAIFADIEYQGKRIRVYNLHLQSTRLGSDADEVLKKKNIANLNDKQTQAKYKRIGSKLKQAFIKRTEQARAIAKSIRDCPHPVIVCGDMNDTPMSYAYHTIASGLKDSFYEQGFGLGSTYAGSLPALRIDYVLASQVLRIYNHQVIRQTQSDHYPVVATIGL